MTILDVFLELSTSDATVRREVTRRREGDEEVVVVALEGDHSIANATFWERPHVGGLVDFEVISTDGVQQLWRHLEGPTEDALRTAWRDMMGTINAHETRK